MDDFKILLIYTDVSKDIVVDEFSLHDASYCAISYRWKDVEEWSVETPLYTAFITSFSKNNFGILCNYCRERGVKWIWLDGICVNQRDEDQKTKYLKRMNDIYESAEKIIGVPDLGYDNLPYISEDESANLCEALTYKQFNEIYDESSLIHENHIRDIGTEWCIRTWVISERFIGIKNKKLEIKMLSVEASVEIMMHIFEFFELHIGDIDIFSESALDFEDQHNVIECILLSECSKYEDKFYSILPHTKYKNIVIELLDKKIHINTFIAFKIILFEILDIEGKIRMLYSQKYDHDITFFSFFNNEYYNRSFGYMNKYNIVCDISMNDNLECLRVKGRYWKKDKYLMIVLAESRTKNIVMKCVNKDNFWVYSNLLLMENIEKITMNKIIDIY
jgi:hypothetical protein